MHGLAEVLDEIEDVLSRQRALASRGRRVRRELVDVGAGHKRLVACTSQDHDPNAIVVPELEHRHGEARRASAD